MKQAFQHINPGTTYYDHITDQIKKTVETWNSTHNSKVDIKVIAKIFLTIFKYHHWIKVSDIEPAIDLGLMGDLGENKGLNTESIFNWFKGYSKRMRDNEIKTHSAYKTESTFISMEQRKETRDSLIQTFMNFYDEYKSTKAYDKEMNHYLPVFFRWFKNLGYITIDEDKEQEMYKQHALMLRDMRSFFMQKEGKQNTITAKTIFIDAFNLAIENNYPIQEQLKQMKL